jgi:CTP-dependent riboflavin kinase
MKIKGKVVKGIGESKGFLSIDWVDQQLKEKLKFQPYYGTLNITIDDAHVQGMLKEKAADRLVHQTEGFCDAVLIKGLINDKYECGVVIPLVKNYDERLLEVVASVHLKQALHVEDGDEVYLDLYLEGVPE